MIYKDVYKVNVKKCVFYKVAHSIQLTCKSTRPILQTTLYLKPIQNGAESNVDFFKVYEIQNYKSNKTNMIIIIQENI